MIYLDLSSGEPLYLQIYKQIRQDILKEEIIPGKRLPAMRQLAQDLNVSRNTVENAYQQLMVEGYIFSVRGSGFFVSHLDSIYPSPENSSEREYRNLPKTPKKTFDKGLEHGENIDQKISDNPIRYDFIYGSVSTKDFPMKEWKRHLTDGIEKMQKKERISYPHKQGISEFREALAKHLKSTRSVNCSREQIVITSSLQQSVEIIGRILKTEKSHVAVEEPGHIRSRLVFQNMGFSVSPVPVGESGIRIDRLWQSKCDIVYITPSHQFPSGVVMPIGTRHQILEWAAHQESYIIEDDYDSEFRYNSKPIPALQGIDQNDRTIYIGSFSKALSSDIRISYLVLPNHLLDSYHDCYKGYPCSVPWLYQSALSDFLTSGGFDRHLRKIRQVYQKRYNVLLKSLTENFGDRIEILQHDAGLHLMIILRSSLSKAELMERAKTAGIRIFEASVYWMHPENCPDKMFLLGFSSLSEDDIRLGIQRLKEAWE